MHYFLLTRKQGESQASVHQCQVKDLESAFSTLRSDLLDAKRIHEDKVMATYPYCVVKLLE